MKTIAIGVGENENIIQACHIFKEKHPKTDIKLIYNDADLVNSVLDKNIDAVVRGSLPASNIMQELKEQHMSMERNTSSFYRLSVSMRAQMLRKDMKLP